MRLALRIVDQALGAAAFNFILHDSLGGGGTESLINDAQGKTHALGLLEMEVEVPEELVRR